ncbi:MAG: SIS domain-containing protein [Gammaproteobacteria bacterium]
MNLEEYISVHNAIISDLAKLASQIEKISKVMIAAIKNGGKIFWMGNGGSAADAQHLACELVVRLKRQRPAIASLALTTDTSILTAAANDYDFSQVFSRQLEALCSPRDVVVGISTSGNSKNVLSGIETANKIGAFTVGFTGQNGGKLASICSECLCVDSAVTERIQEAHIFLGHVICDVVEKSISNG